MARGDLTISFDGVAKLESKMAAMGKNAKPALLQALRGAAKVIQIAARGNVKKGKDRPGHKGGTLAASIKVRSSARKGAVYVGTSGSENLFSGKTFYGGMVEYGHGIGKRPTRKKKRSQGGKDLRPQVPPHPFLSKAVKQKRSQLQSVIASQFDWAALKRGHG